MVQGLDLGLLVDEEDQGLLELEPGHAVHLGLALNSMVLFNSPITDAAVKQSAADGFPVTGAGPAAPTRPEQRRRDGRRRR